MSMIKAIVTDFSRVLLFPVDDFYRGGLNELNQQLLEDNPNYDFKRYFRINKELLEYYNSLNLPVYIFTSETVQEHPAIKDDLNSVFSGVFSAKHLNVSKTDKSAYLVVANRLSLQPSQILYIDDKSSNVEAAKTAGCLTILYTSNANLVDTIKNYSF